MGPKKIFYRKSCNSLLEEKMLNWFWSIRFSAGIIALEKKLKLNQLKRGWLYMTYIYPRLQVSIDCTPEVKAFRRKLAQNQY